MCWRQLKQKQKQKRLDRLADTRKHGKYGLRRLAGTGVADLWVALRSKPEERLVELQVVLASIIEQRDNRQGFDRGGVVHQAAAVASVRPANVAPR